MAFAVILFVCHHANEENHPAAHLPLLRQAWYFCIRSLLHGGAATFNYYIDQTTPARATLITTRNRDGSVAHLAGTGQRELYYVYDTSGNNARETVKPTPTRLNSPITEMAYSAEELTDGIYRTVTRTRYNAAGNPLVSVQKSLVSNLSDTLESKNLTIDERNLTSTQWVEYHNGTKRKSYNTLPTSDITAEAVSVDGFTLSQADNAGVTTTAGRSYTANGVTHLITETRDNKGRSTGYTYAKNGTVQQTVTTGYGSDGRIATAGFLHGGPEKQFSYEYLSGTHLLEKLTMPNNMTLTQSYEIQRDLLTGMAYHRGTTLVTNRQYSYDSLGRPTTRNTSRQGTVKNDTFGYNTRSNHPCLWLITWDSSQPIATRPLAIQKDGTWNTSGWDLTKNICELYGSNGYIRTAYTYTPYGEVTESTNGVYQPIQWSSEYNDTELGLVYYNYRHYNPMEGRWLGWDTLLNKNSIKNPYHYASNSKIV